VHETFEGVMTDPAPASDRLEIIDLLLRRGGAVLLAERGKQRTIEEKRSASDIVTDADRASERAILGALAWRARGDGWLSEESGFRPGESNRTWMIDPLDGTVNYTAGLDDFGVIVGLVEDGRPVAGGMYLPARDVMYLAERGAGARRGGEPIEVSKVTALRDAVFDHSLANIPEIAAEQGRTLAALISEARAVRCVHSLTYLARVAEGTYDGFLYHSLALWDICGPSVILEEAGAKLTGLDGRPLHLRPSRAAHGRLFAAIAANPDLLRAALAAIVAAA
jgi:myo-inositol-1(or 4)-monophosphatase